MPLATGRKAFAPASPAPRTWRPKMAVMLSAPLPAATPPLGLRKRSSYQSAGCARLLQTSAGARWFVPGAPLLLKPRELLPVPFLARTQTRKLGDAVSPARCGQCPGAQKQRERNKIATREADASGCMDVACFAIRRADGLPSSCANVRAC